MNFDDMSNFFRLSSSQKGLIAMQHFFQTAVDDVKLVLLLFDAVLYGK